MPVRISRRSRASRRLITICVSAGGWRREWEITTSFGRTKQPRDDVAAEGLFFLADLFGRFTPTAAPARLGASVETMDEAALRTFPASDSAGVVVDVLVGEPRPGARSTRGHAFARGGPPPGLEVCAKCPPPRREGQSHSMMTMAQADSPTGSRVCGARPGLVYAYG